VTGRVYAVGAASPYSIGVLRWDDECAVAAVLARAFVDDPLVRTICDMPSPQRLERMRWGFRVAVRAHCLSAQPAWTIVNAAGEPVGVVLVSRAGAAPPARSDVLFTLRGFWHIGLRAGIRGARAADIIMMHAPVEPFTYLRTLGIDPALHGCGLGSRLVEQVLRVAPSTMPVYLETAKRDNIRFYARHGFQCIGEFRCLSVPVWRLRRPAARLLPSDTRNSSR